MEVMETPVEESQPVPQPASGNTVAEKTICLAIKSGRFGNSRAVPMHLATIDADTSLLGMSSQLLSSPELDKVAKLDAEIGAWLRSIGFSSMFKGGIYRISLAQVPTVIEKLKEFEARRKVLVDLAVETYETRQAETAARLKVAHNPSNYPSKPLFRSKFYFEWSWVTFDTPTRLKHISEAIFQSEAEKASEKLTAVADQCRDVMRAGLAKLVDHMVERLTPGEDGKAKRFTKNLVGNMQEFLNTFDLRNVTDDTELDAIVKKARALLNGVDASTLKDEVIKAKVLDDFQQVQALLEPMVADRMIALDDDAEGEL